ncbi:hypothetical protein [Rubrivirga sp.]|uniref:hypothetical protein n=1 Tax=Rubrivirga sp. TaxID=1885344 RepID=UPI003B529826
MLRLSTLAFTFLLATTPRAQGDSEELLRAVLSAFGSGAGGEVSAELYETWPEAVDRDLLPAGAVPIGGFRLSSDVEGPLGDPVTAGFARLDEAPQDAAAAFAARPLPGEWTSERSRYQSGSFRLCSPDLHGDALFSARAGGTTYVTVSVERGGCHLSGQDAVVVDEPQEMDDVIGDGEIIDEPGEPRPHLPDVPEIDPNGETIQLVDGFGFSSNPGERPGAYSTAWLHDHTVASGAAQVDAAFEADGWSRLGSHLSDGTQVSVWSREDEEGRQVIATLTVRANGDGAEASITATR